MLKDAPKFYELAKRIIEITEDCIIVAHNSVFDYRILRTEFKRLGYTYKRESLCTVELAKTLLPDEDSYSLGKLARSLGIPMSDRHRANGDAIATVKLFKILLSKDLEKYIVKDAISVDHGDQLKASHRDIIEGLNADTGVFYIYNTKNEIIYIGKSRNIKHRLNQFLTDESKKSRYIQRKISRVEFEKTGTDLIAHLKMQEEIRKNRPKLNNNSSKPLITHALTSYLDANGYINLRIERYIRKNNPIISFSNLHSARHYLERLIEKNGLCMGLCGYETTKDGCFKHKINECKGACLLEEDSLTYNKRLKKIMGLLSYSDRKIGIIDRGRDIDEKSIVYIEYGKLIGLGFYNLNHQINNKVILDKMLTCMKDSSEAHYLIKKYLSKGKYKKLLIFDT